MQPVNPRNTALLVVDMQNGYCDPKGNLSKVSGVDTTPLQEVVPKVQRLVEACKRLELPVMWSVQQHLPQDKMRRERRVPSHIEKRTVEPAAPRGTWHAEIVPSLQPLVEPDDFVIIKHRFSMFYSTTLDSILQMLTISHLVVCGVSTNVCVESTVRDAYFRDYDVTIIEDCVAATMPDLHEASLKNFRIFLGDVVTLSEFLDSHGGLVSAQAG